MFWQVLPCLIIGIIFPIVIGGGYVLTASIYGHTLAIESVAQYVLFILLISSIYYAVSQILSPYQIEMLWIVLYLTLSAVAFMLLTLQIQAKRKIKSEKTLLDLGLDRTGFWLILGGIFLIGSAVSYVIDSFEASPFQFTAREFSRNGCYLSVGILSTYKGSGATVFTDQRIFSLIGSIKWANIRSYAWEESAIPILRLRLRGYWFLLNRTGINIPNTKKNEVQDVLSQQLHKPEDV